MTDVQKVILSIFKIVAEICDNNKIPYYAIGGTCIGAIRHKGFIPWDDDLDIAIPIEYWDKFLSLLKEQLPSDLYLYTCDDIKKYHYPFAKVCDKRTTFIERSEYHIPKAYKGIFIDLMPMSGFPSSADKKVRFIRRIRFLDICNKYRRFPKNFGTLNSLFLSLFFLSIGKLFPYNYFSHRFINELKKYTFSDAVYVGYSWHPEWLPKLIFNKDVFGDGILVPFEDTFIRVPNKYDEYLYQQFGNYMELPPEDKRQQHDGLVDTATPYTYYKNHPIK